MELKYLQYSLGCVVVIQMKPTCVVSKHPKLSLCWFRNK